MVSISKLSVLPFSSCSKQKASFRSASAPVEARTSRSGLYFISPTLSSMEYKRSLFTVLLSLTGLAQSWSMFNKRKRRFYWRSGNSVFCEIITTTRRVSAVRSTALRSHLAEPFFDLLLGKLRFATNDQVITYQFNGGFAAQILCELCSIEFCKLADIRWISVLSERE